MNHAQFRVEVLKVCSQHVQEGPLFSKLSFCGLGAAGEAGEIADEIKKIIFHRGRLTAADIAKLIIEMGDVYWYLEYLGHVLGISTDDVLKANVAKLTARHPHGWSPASQAEKADESTLKARGES